MQQEEDRKHAEEGRKRTREPNVTSFLGTFFVGSPHPACRSILVAVAPSVRIRHPYPFSALMTTISGPRTSSLSFAPRARDCSLRTTMHALGGHMCVWVGGPPVRFSRAFPPHCVTLVNSVEMNRGLERVQCGVSQRGSY